jgi:hypothetical protein
VAKFAESLEGSSRFTALLGEQYKLAAPAR